MFILVQAITFHAGLCQAVLFPHPPSSLVYLGTDSVDYDLSPFFTRKPVYRANILNFMSMDGSLYRVTVIMGIVECGGFLSFKNKMGGHY